MSVSGLGMGVGRTDAAGAGTEVTPGPPQQNSHRFTMQKHPTADVLGSTCLPPTPEPLMSLTPNPV